MVKNSLAPGFRFHPTDVELVRYYLKRKVLGKKFMTNAIAEVDIYKFEPPDLPEKSCLRTGDLKWYFFCPRLKKYPNGGKANRSTESGYWKTTGKDRDVSYNDEVVGKIRTLIFHYGKTPRGERTDWVMHEYRLEDKTLEQRHIPQDTYVVCKLFKKNGLGPRHGSEYGAPFKDEDWSDEEDIESLVAIPDPGPNKESGVVASASHSHPPEDCITGVISESCVSDVPQLTATVLPPLANDVVAHTPLSSPSPLLEVPHAVQDDNDFYSMLDLFVVDNDESLLLDGFNNQGEVGHGTEVPVVEEGLVSLEDVDMSWMQGDEIFIGIDELIKPSTPPAPHPGAS
ncbi:NAC domain containing protein 103 [Hirschfeldia incana]|nr:NAC domain containing protein 103 [Hirschfeldia incana]